MNLDLTEIEKDVRAGLPKVRSMWDQFARETTFFLNQGHRLIPARESEQALDKNLRPKVSLHITSRVVNELAKGLYGATNPSRRITGNDSADALVQAISGEHHVNRQLKKLDSYTWLHGVSAVQICPHVDVVHRRQTGESVIRGNCPVQFRTWQASDFLVWTDDQDQSCPLVVVTRSFVAGKERLQVWSGDAVRTYVGTPVGSAFNPFAQSQFVLDSASSGPNPFFGAIPFVFAHNEDPSDGFWTPGIGYSLTNTHYWLDQVLSDLTQSVSVFAIPEKYSRNLSISTRLVHRPGDPMDLIERDPSKNADIFYSQPKLEVESIWLHIENTLNEALEGLDIPLRVSIQATSQPESGVALIIRRTPLLDRWRERQDLFKNFEQNLWRMSARVATISLDQPELVGASTIDQALEIIDSLEVECDFPEASFPIPSQEKDLSDTWEMEQGIKSRVMVVMERTGRTRPQAIEFIRQVAEDEAAIASPGTAAAAPPLRILGARDVYEHDFSAAAEAPGGLAPETGNPKMLPAKPPEAATPGATAAFQP